MNIKSILYLFSPPVVLPFFKRKRSRYSRQALPEIVADEARGSSWRISRSKFGKRSAKLKYPVAGIHQEDLKELRIAEVEQSQVPYIRGRYPGGRNPSR